MGFGKDNKGVIMREQASIAIGTLAANTALKVDSGAIGITEDFRMLKSEICAHLDGITATEGEGLMFGICNGELSVSQIAQCLTTDGPKDPSARTEQETAERFVKILSMIDNDNDGQNVIFRNENGGPIITAKPRWTFSNQTGWDFFVYNDGGSAFTTGATLRLLMTHYGVWLQ